MPSVDESPLTGRIEAKIPTHVFSLSEKALMEVHETQQAALFKHNKVRSYALRYEETVIEMELEFLYASISEGSSS